MEANKNIHNMEYFKMNIKNIVLSLIFFCLIYACTSPVTFEETPYIQVTGVEIGVKDDEQAAIIEDNGTLQLLASFTPTNAYSISKSAVWSSSNHAIATVTSEGKVTAVSNGTVEITAKSESQTTISNVITLTISNQVVDVAETLNIFSKLDINKNLSLGNAFITLLKGLKPDLFPLLESSVKHTLFIPVNNAMKGNKASNLNLLSKADREAIIKYHIVSGAQKSTTPFAANYNTLAGTTSDHQLFISGKKVSNKSASPDIEANILTPEESKFKDEHYPNIKTVKDVEVPSNGLVIHFIDKLLVPSSLMNKFDALDYVDPSGVTITTTEMKIDTRGGELILTATVQPEKAWQEVVWSVDNSSIAEVKTKDDSFVLSPLKNGTVKVTATTKLGTKTTGKKYSKTMTVVITEQSPYVINGGATSYTITKKGEFYALSVNAEPNENVVWTIDESDRGLVDFSSSNGLTQVDAGTTTVTEENAVYVRAISDFNGTVAITAKPTNSTLLHFTLHVTGQIPPSAVSISGSKRAYKGGDEISLSASVMSNESPNGVDQRVTWSSSSDTLATVSDSGLVTMKATGDYDGSRTVSITATSVVNPSISSTYDISF